MVKKINGIGVLDDGTVITNDINKYLDMAKRGKKAIYVGSISAL